MSVSCITFESCPVEVHSRSQIHILCDNTHPVYFYNCRKGATCWERATDFWVESEFFLIFIALNGWINVQFITWCRHSGTIVKPLAKLNYSNVSVIEKVENIGIKKWINPTVIYYWWPPSNVLSTGQNLFHLSVSSIPECAAINKLNHKK